MSWISIDEALPRYGQKVLIYKTKHSTIELAWLTHTNSGGNHWSVDYSHYVTHWMPLPEPPLNDTE